MTQTRTAYHHGDLRSALVASAVQLVEQHGPAAFSLREAARDVGVSPNAAYRHFEDKSSLMTATAAAGFADMAERMQAAMAQQSRRRGAAPAMVERFKAVGRAYVEFACERPKLFRLMFSEWGAGCLGPAAAPPAVTPWTLLGAALDGLVADGLLSPIQREGAELKAWSVVHGFACLAIEGLAIEGLAAEPGGTAHAEELESLLNFAVAGLGFEAVEPT